MIKTGLDSKTLPAEILEFIGSQCPLKWHQLNNDALPLWFTISAAKAVHEYTAHELYSLIKAKQEQRVQLELSIDLDQLWQTLSSSLANLSILSKEDLSNDLSMLETSARRHLIHEYKLQHESTIIDRAISEFKELLTKPVPRTGNVAIIEPGLKTGLKLAACDVDGNVICHSILFPHEPQNQWQQSIRKFDNFISTNRIKSLVLASGEGYRESRRFIKSWLANQSSTLACYSIQDIGLDGLDNHDDSAPIDNLYSKVDALALLAINPEQCIAQLNLKGLLRDPLLTVVRQNILSSRLKAQWQTISENLMNSSLSEDPLIKSPVLNFVDLKEKMSLKGKVTNKTEYGYFLDIGITENGLLHNSKVSAGLKPEVGSILDVTVLNINHDKGQYSLSTGPGTMKPKKKPHKSRSRQPGNSAMADALKAAMTKKH